MKLVRHRNSSSAGKRGAGAVTAGSEEENLIKPEASRKLLETWEMIHIFFFTAASFSSFSGGPNICPRCNKTVYFGKHWGGCTRMQEDPGVEEFWGVISKKHFFFPLCFCSGKGVVSWQELAPALPALREMQQDSVCRQPCGGEGLNRTMTGGGNYLWRLKCISIKS